MNQLGHKRVNSVSVITAKSLFEFLIMNIHRCNHSEPPLSDKSFERNADSSLARCAGNGFHDHTRVRGHAWRLHRLPSLPAPDLWQGARFTWSKPALTADTSFVREMLKPDDATASKRIEATVVRISFTFSSFGAISLKSIGSVATVTMAILVKLLYTNSAISRSNMTCAPPGRMIMSPK